jgi:hypothetical protein
MSDLAKSYLAGDKIEDALALETEELRLIRQSPGNQSRARETLENLEFCYRKLGRSNEADAIQREILASTSPAAQGTGRNQSP